MADSGSESSLKEVSEGLKSIFERIADFFDLFDLSFLVSGATTLGALSYWGWRADVQLPPLPAGWMSSVGLLIACYVLGLVTFALGRWIRVGLRRGDSQHSFDGAFLDVLNGHGLANPKSFKAYLEREGDARGIWRLYARLWSEVRNTPTLTPSFSLLRRYWVMAATYDGLTVALIVWAIACIACAFGVGGARPIDKSLALPAALGALIAAVAASREAGRYFEYQVEELVASIATRYGTALNGQFEGTFDNATHRD